MVCTILTIIEMLEVTQVYVRSLTGEDYTPSNPAPLNTDTVIEAQLNRFPSGGEIVKVYDNDSLIKTITTVKDKYPSGFYYKFTTSGTHNVCAEVV